VVINSNCQFPSAAANPISNCRSSKSESLAVTTDERIRLHGNFRDSGNFGTMKTRMIFFFSLLSATAFAQAGLWWSGEMTVDSVVYSTSRPRIVLTAGDVPLVVWGGGTNQPVYAARWNGSAFGTPVAISPAGIDPYYASWTGPEVAAAGDTVFVVFKDQPLMSEYIYVVKSTDGGLTWSDTVRVDGATGPYTDFPSIAVSPSGNPSVMYMTMDSAMGNHAYVVSTSTDGGQTFPAPVNVSMLGGSEVCDCCPAFMDFQGSALAATWRRNSTNLRDMWTGISTDGGATFPAGFDVDHSNWNITSCPSTGPSPYLWNDSLFTVFMSRASGPMRINLSAFGISTQTGATTEIAANYAATVSQTLPFISGSGDTMGVVWQQTASANVDIYFSWSVSGSAGLVNNEAMINTVTTGSQRAPHVVYSGGIFHVVFVDGTSNKLIYKTATIGTVGMNEETATPSLPAYPNPSAGTMTLDLSATQGQPAAVLVRDISGRIVETVAVNGAQRVSLAAQPAGVYFAEVSAAGKTYVTRLVFLQD
jgi:hypothetical protein